ncbi:MAG: polyribonucleotide nucleotidyltransferase [bacterium]
MDNYEIRIGIGGANDLILQTGKLAKQANGSVVVRNGDTVVLVAVTASKEPREDIDYFPLTVDFEEKLYAAGKIPGGYIKREGRPSEHATLTSRLIDRPIRPLFPKNYHNEVQIIATALSSDLENPIDVCGIVGASVALSISDIPFFGPVGAVRVGRINGNFIINPTYQQIDQGDLNLVVAGTSDAIIMVECGAKQVPESVILDAIKEGHKAIIKIVEAQLELAEKAGRPKQEVAEKQLPDGLVEDIEKFAEEKIREALNGKMKQEREAMIEETLNAAVEQFSEKYEGCEGEIAEIITALEKRVFRENIREHQTRPDGRALDQIRPITCETGLLPRTHGSSLFTRGQTQVLTTVTLGTISEGQRIDGITTTEGKRFMHQYNFPPYCVGETRPFRGPSRRDIGHGALVERSILPIIPAEEEFPYTIRVVSEVLESNGSSSMASVCATSMALMDAGVPTQQAIAGVAMGLVIDEAGHYILTDIQGIEDSFGDMDFKIAGTRTGINALQMDIKVKGITPELMRTALAQANEARMFILDKMEADISKPRPELSALAPRIIQYKVGVDKIGEVIGPGGKNIRKITEETDSKVDILEDGRIYIYSTDKESGEKALGMIQLLVQELEVGKEYWGEVKRIMSFGAVVEMLPGKDGLVHISQISDKRIEKVQDVLKVGQKVKVRVREIDDTGKVSLTMKGVR